MSVLVTEFRCQMESMEVFDAGEADRMISCDLEAAETLAGLARCPAMRGRTRQTVDERGATFSGHASSQDQAIPVQQFCGSASPIVTGVLETNETDSIVPSQLCSTSCHSNSTKLKQNLTEAEKEERKIRRILANRESARQTIRRRKAMHLEFTRKVVELAEVNESLKREKELALKKHDSLKDKNEFLKLQISKVKIANSRQAQEEPKVSRETTSPVNSCTPFRPYNQTLFTPLFVPSVVPSPDLLQFQNASHPEVNGSLQFPMRPYGTPFVHHGQENHTGNTGSGNLVFILPVPWLLPCVGHCNALLHTHSQESKRPREASAAHQHSALSTDHHQISSNRCVGMEDSSFSKFVPARTSSGAGLTFQVESGDQYAGHHCDPLVPEVPTSVESIQNLRPLHSLVDDIDDRSKISAPEHLSQSFSPKKNQERVISNHKKSENLIAATKARKKRKELMRLKTKEYSFPSF